MINFKDFVKTYDVRGLVGTQLTEDVIAAFGAAFVDELDLAGKQLVIGHDMRDSSPEFAAAFAAGAQKRGGNPMMLGLCSTDMTYFASGKLDLPSVMFTASHNPASYNGMKFSRAGAKGIGLDSGLGAIRDRAQNYFDSSIPPVSALGVIQEINLTVEYVEYLRKLVDLSKTRRLKIVVDAANGMGGFTVPLVLGDAAGLPALNLEIIPLFFELDGTFPNHEANPLQVENLRDLQKAVVEHGADLGLAFDGDADRCFAVDETGGLVSPSALAAIVSIREIERVKQLGETDITILHFWGADNGMLAALHLISELGTYPGTMSELSQSFSPYFSSGEINSTVADVPAALDRLKAAFPDCTVEQFDGHTFSFENQGNWFWFNVRSSNTEPLLRLNVESNQEASMQKIRDQAIAAIGHG